MSDHPPQARRGWLFLWLLYFLFAAAAQINDGVAQALFLKRTGIALLPHMFAIKAALDLGAAALYMPLASLVGQRHALSSILGICAAGTAALLWAVLEMRPSAYPALYAFSEVTQTLFKIHWGVVLLDYLPREAALRQIPLVYSGSRVGAVVGGAVLALARRVGAARLLIVAAATYALTLLGWLGGAPRPVVAPERPRGPLQRLRSGAGALRSPLLWSILGATALLVCCRYALRYRYSEVIAATFSEEDLATVYGAYVAGAGVVSGALQAFVTSRLLAGVGLARANLLYAGLLPCAFAAFHLASPLVAAAIARLVETELKAAMKTPVSNLFYGGLPLSQRAAARSLVLGVLVPLATVGASLLVGYAAASSRWWGLVLALCFVPACVAQNRAYSAQLATLDERAKRVAPEVAVHRADE